MTKERIKELENERIAKNSARTRVTSAIKSGQLKKEACFCGETKVEAHHADYNKPLDVIWACKKHHIELDRIRVNQELEERTGIIL